MRYAGRFAGPFPKKKVRACLIYCYGYYINKPLMDVPGSGVSGWVIAGDLNFINTRT